MPNIPAQKKYFQAMPWWLGAMAARVPYGWRPGFGSMYRARQRQLLAYEEKGAEERRAFILQRVVAIAAFATANVPFYRDHFARHGFSVQDVRAFEDIENIPVVTKSQLQEWELERRSCERPGRYVQNTGGSSGEPLSFYITPDSISHEWAHMHHIWAKLGYRQRHLKFCFGGRDLGNDPVMYDGLRHHYAVSIYAPYAVVGAAMKGVLKRHRVAYVHGYPSALYDFACYCEEHDHELVELLARQLRGAFLGSEFPNPVYRDKIESVFGVDSVSWYGHTERSVLAWERHEKFVYEPFGTYGYAESAVDPDTGREKLIATSYYNYASPFIRYDTGDEIRVVRKQHGMLEAFAIEGGREGDYVLDATGKRISLTGLVFGRHHRVFEVAKFVQIFQDRPGEASILITPRCAVTREEAAAMFDASGVGIRFDYQIISEPIKTQSGKVVLKVHERG